MNILYPILQLLIQGLTLLILVHVVLTYFLSPYHPVRRAIDQVVEPMLTPIRRLLPPTGGIDFSPMVLMIVIQLLGSVLLSVLR